MTPEKPDPRVDIMCRAIWLGDDDPYHAQAIADGFAALESAGWRIVKLEQVGWADRNDWLHHVESQPTDQPVYRITEEKP